MPFKTTVNEIAKVQLNNESATSFIYSTYNKLQDNRVCTMLSTYPHLYIELVISRSPCFQEVIKWAFYSETHHSFLTGGRVPVLKLKETQV